jgi:hypothetical protein
MFGVARDLFKVVPQLIEAKKAQELKARVLDWAGRLGVKVRSLAV